jgi:hypothetical protein
MATNHNSGTMKQPLLLLFFALTSSFLQAQPLDWIWAHHYGGMGYDRVDEIAIDGQGALYITGYFADSILTDNGYVVGQGGNDIFVAKLDSSNGHPIWLKTVGGSQADFGLGIACDEDGNCFLSGVIIGPANVDFDGIPLAVGNQGMTMYLAHIDSSGQFQWARIIDGSGPLDEAAYSAMVLDEAGNCYLTGSFKGNVSFDNQTVKTSTGNDFDVFLARFDASGSLNWVETFGDGQLDQGFALALSDSGYLHLGGRFRGNPDFGGQTLSGQGSDDIFVARLDTTGQIIWASQLGSTGNETVQNLAIGKDGSTYLTGYFLGPDPFSPLPVQSQGNDFYLAKLDANGQFQWARTVSSISTDRGWDVSCDGNGQVFVSGEYGNGAMLDNHFLNSKGTSDVFLAQYDAQGVLVNYRLIESPGPNRGFHIALDGKTRGYLVGTFSDTGTFGSQSIVGIGKEDGFVAQFEHLNTTGILSPAPLPRLLVYPNPSTGQFSLGQSFPPGSRIQVSNSLGQRLISAELSLSNPELNIPGPHGVYHLLVTNPEGEILGREKVLVK